MNRDSFTTHLFHSRHGGNPKKLADATANKMGEKQAVLHFLRKSDHPRP
jgi:hypothetical protein